MPIIKLHPPRFELCATYHFWERKKQKKEHVQGTAILTCQKITQKMLAKLHHSFEFELHVTYHFTKQTNKQTNKYKKKKKLVQGTPISQPA